MGKTKKHSCNQIQKINKLFSKGNVNKAIIKCEKLCNTCPSDPDAWSLYSKLSFHLGNNKNAITASLRAISLDPNHLDAHRNAGQAYMRITQPQSAIPHYHKYVVLCPNDPVALYNLGNALNQQGSNTDALKWLKRAVEQKADYLDAHMSLGYTFKNLGCITQATNSFKKVLELDKNKLQAKLELGLCQQLLGNYDEALLVFDEILTKDPNQISAASGKAYVHSRMGNHQLAYEEIKFLLKVKNPNAQVLQIFGMIADKINKTDDAINALTKFLSNYPENNATHSNLKLQLGRLYESKKKYNEAFTYYSAAKLNGNQISNSDPYIKLMEAAKKQFNADFFSEVKNTGNTSEVPIFIIGMPRSGTTLVEQIIASHSCVYGAGELPDFFETLTRLRNNPMYAKNSDLLIPPPNEIDLAQEANNYLETLEDLANDVTRVTDKMPHNFILLGLIALLFPKARIIHCKRHPLDTCLSIFFNPFSEVHGYANRLEDLGKHYIVYMDLMNHWKQVLPLKIFEIQYEDLINDQETTSKRLINFCDLEWEESCFSFYKTDRSIATMSSDQASKPIYSSSIGRWKHYEKHLTPLMMLLDQTHGFANNN